jgi:hypothetical protein
MIARSEIQNAVVDGKLPSQSEISLPLIKPALIWEYYARLHPAQWNMDSFAVSVGRHKVELAIG